MKPERWEQVAQLYGAALDREGSARAAFLGEACAGDEDLRREVESLLAREGKEASFLESPALEAAAKALAQRGRAEVRAFRVPLPLLKWKARPVHCGAMRKGRRGIQLGAEYLCYPAFQVGMPCWTTSWIWRPPNHPTWTSC